MRLEGRLKSLESIADRTRPRAVSTMRHPGDEMRSLFSADRGSALIVLRVRAWISCKARGAPEVEATIARLLAVIEERKVRMRALNWPPEGLGDDPPEAHEEGPPNHLRDWCGPSSQVAS